jgi:diguanylate cyclase (GGDEF)-like protein
MQLGIRGIVHPDDLHSAKEHLKRIAEGTDGIDYATRNRTKNGEWRWLAWTTPAPRYANGHLRRSYVVGRDMTIQKQAEQEFLHQAQHDSLSRLANRAHFDQALEQALARASRSGSEVALLLIDLDGFKTINDSDLVLKNVAERLRTVQRKGDLVARIGGDEFACLMEDPLAEALDTIATPMLAIVGEPIRIGMHEVGVGCSIGIARCSGGAETTATLYGRADQAMYQAKAAGKCGFRHAAPRCAAFPVG